MSKSPDAFRTISEVAAALDTPSHVLRFWETRFPQIRPVKRAGGRRYYRPTDVALLSGIKRLLHDEGLTIRGVQKILREQGVRHVASLATGFEALDEAAMLAAEMATFQGDDDDGPIDHDAAESAQVIALQSAIGIAPRAPNIAPADPVPEAPMAEWAQPESADITPLPRPMPPRPMADAAEERPKEFTVTRITDTAEAPLSSVTRSLDAPARDLAADPQETLASRLRRLRSMGNLPQGPRADLPPILARAIRLRDHLATPPHGAGRGRD